LSLQREEGQQIVGDGTTSWTGSVENESVRTELLTQSKYLVTFLNHLVTLGSLASLVRLNVKVQEERE
jgi:hypothetical protein